MDATKRDAGGPAGGEVRDRVLEPMERISEVLFGLIMALTFTGSLSVAEAGRGEVTTMLIGALGCNIAWGLIDAVMYLMAATMERARERGFLKALREAPDEEAARRVAARALPADVAAAAGPADLDAVRSLMARVPEPEHRGKLGARDWRGAAGVFVLVVLSTFPVVVPFLVFGDVVLAMRWSNGTAVAMLFLLGYAFGRRAGLRPWRVGAGMVVVGGVLVAMTIALGG